MASTIGNPRPILHGTTQPSRAAPERRFVFRLLGSVYDEDKGEQEAHPTVLNVKISASSEQEAERKIGAAIERLSETVEAIRLSKIREQEERDRAHRLSSVPKPIQYIHQSPPDWPWTKNPDPKTLSVKDRSLVEDFLKKLKV